MKGICPKCGKNPVIGVSSRVEELADFPSNFIPKNHKTVEYIIPLAEIIAEIFNIKSTSSKKVQNEYIKLYSTLGDEFSILRELKIIQIHNNCFEQLASGIEKMRSGKVNKTPGYDGVYGKIKVFSENNHLNQITGQQTLI